MVPMNRRVTYKLDPTAAQERQLWQCHKLHCDLYNAARQERIDAYRLAGRKKRLAERQHQGGCGFVATRDRAALSMLADGLNLLGREPTWAARPETPRAA